MVGIVMMMMAHRPKLLETAPTSPMLAGEGPGGDGLRQRRKRNGTGTESETGMETEPLDLIADWKQK